MKIVIDAFGGDNAPLEIIKGAVAAAEQFNAEIALSGNEKKIKQVAQDNNISIDNIEIIDCDDVIEMCDEPTSILREHKNSSMAVGLQAVADGKGDAFISAGSTGALTVGATFIGKRIKGIKRTALAPLVPTSDKPTMMVDSGANADCRAEMLFQFAVMGDIYMKNVLGVENPRIGLLNVGTEDTKGGQLQKDTFEMLKASDMNFIGNVEARDVILNAVCDVLVTDGFSGNIFLKATEGVSLYILKSLKAAMTSSLKAKLGALALKDKVYEIKDKFDASQHGGAVMLGSRIPVIKIHGNSEADAIPYAVRQAIYMCENDVTGKIERKLCEIKEKE